MGRADGRHGRRSIAAFLPGVSKALDAPARPSGVGPDAARTFGPGKLDADARQELRKPVEFMTYTVISAQAFEFHNRNYLPSMLSGDEWFSANSSLRLRQRPRDQKIRPRTCLRRPPLTFFLPSGTTSTVACEQARACRFIGGAPLTPYRLRTFAETLGKHATTPGSPSNLSLRI